MSKCENECRDLHRVMTLYKPRHSFAFYSSDDS